jgi:hypothetical protein
MPSDCIQRGAGERGNGVGRQGLAVQAVVHADPARDRHCRERTAGQAPAEPGGSCIGRKRQVRWPDYIYVPLL